MTEDLKKIPRKYFQVRDLMGDKIVVEKGLLKSVTGPFNQWLDARKKVTETEESISFRQSVIRLEITNTVELRKQMAVLSKEIQGKSGFSAEEIAAQEEEILQQIENKKKSRRKRI